MYKRQGQQVSLRSLLYGLMLRSGNDAALEIALHIGKTQKKFVQMMNEKAKEIGMLDTHFANPSGLDEEDGGNLSSAYDMALLMSYAMKNPAFREISGTKYYTCLLYTSHRTSKSLLLFLVRLLIGITPMRMIWD